MLFTQLNTANSPGRINVILNVYNLQAFLGIEINEATS